MQHNKDLDFIRSILIILMILIHIVSFGNAYPHLKTGILSFMMPTFLIITGYLVNIEKDGKRFGKYLLCLFLPYVILESGFSILSYFLPVRDGITELSVAQICQKIFITSIGPYWFIQTMIVCGALYYACFHTCDYISNKLLKGKGPIGLTSRLFLLATLFLLVGKTPILSVTAATYYFIGVVIRQCHIDFGKLFRPSPIAFILWALLLLNEQRYEWGFIAVVFSCWCCISALMWLSRINPSRRLESTLLYIGRNTLPIYLFHPIFTMAAKFYHPLFSFDKSELLCALFTILLSILGSIAIAWIMEKTRIAYIFGKKSLLR